MKVAKYILSVFLIIGAFSFIGKGDLIAGLLTLILGGTLLPPISDRIKEQIILFQNKKVRYIFYIALFAIAGTFMSKSEAEEFGSKEGVLINYIKKNKSDKSLLNIKKLVETERVFGYSNYSLIHPHDGYISEQYDSIKKVSTLVFNPKLFRKNKDIKHFNIDDKNGILKDYSITFIINNKDSIISKTTKMRFSKSGIKTFSNNNVPNINTFLNYKIIDKQKVIAKKREEKRQEKIRFNEIMGNDDFWNKYAPLVKKRIYNLILKKDCRELQKEFNTAANMMDRKQKSGISASKEVELSSFLDTKMREIGCYS